MVLSTRRFLCVARARGARCRGRYHRPNRWTSRFALLAVTAAMFIGWCLPAGAADWLTPEAATRSFYESIQRIEDAPDTPEFKAEIEEIFTDDAVVLLVVGDQSSGFLTVGALETAAKLALKKKYRRQINDSGKEIASINCTTHGAMAACYITVEVTLREGSGGSRTFEDIVNLRRQDGRWYVTRAKWLIVPNEDAKTLYSLALDPTTIANIRANPPAMEREWNRKLPILGKKVYAMGIDLPRPYGVAVIPNWTRQKLELDSLSVRFNGSEVIETDWVDFAGIFTETTSIQVKGDFFLFPFLNVFATVGHVEGDVVAPLSFLARDLIDLVDPDICSGFLTPGFCDRRINGTVRTSLSNNNVSLGIVPAMGYENFFFAMPVTYAWTFLDNAKVGSPVGTFLVSPRIGLTEVTKNGGRLSVYVGATYLKSENRIVSDYTLTIPSDLPIVGGRDIVIEYDITQSGVDPWNYVVGFNWDIIAGRSLTIEASTGGSRDQFIASFTQRF